MEEARGKCVCARARARGRMSKQAEEIGGRKRTEAEEEMRMLEECPTGPKIFNEISLFKSLGRQSIELVEISLAAPSL